MRRLSYLLMTVGVIVFFFPILSEWINDQNQNRLLEEWELSFTVQAKEEAQNRYQQLEELFLQANNLTNTDVNQNEPIEIEELPSQDSQPMNAEATVEAGTQNITIDSKKETAKKIAPIGIIAIDKINLKLPILEGASEQNMKSSAVHITETSPIGEVGNAALAAHRARSKGRLFNQLDELEIGDTITITVGKDEYVYTVFNVSIVEPTDVSVLNRNNKDKVLTLITCDPIENATHRLIIHAKM